MFVMLLEHLGIVNVWKKLLKKLKSIFPNNPTEKSKRDLRENEITLNDLTFIYLFIKI